MWRLSNGLSSKVRNQASKQLTRNSKSRRQQSSQSGADVKPPAGLPQAVPPAAQPLPPLPPPPTKGGGFILKLLGLTTVGVGGVIGYAWYDADFRKLLEDNVPYSAEALKEIFQYLPHRDALFTSSSVGDVPALEDKGLWKSKEVVNKESPLVPEPEAPAPMLTPKQAAAEKKRREAEEVTRLLKQKQANEAAENAALEVRVENAIERCNEASRTAREAQLRVIATTQVHTDLLKTAMEDGSQIMEKDAQWDAVGRAFRSREDAIMEAEVAVPDARDCIEHLKTAIQDGKSNKVTQRNLVLIGAQEVVNKTSNELNKTTSKVTKAETDGRVMIKYKDLIDKGRLQFKQELESIMPDVTIGDRRAKKLTEDEMNSLIAHAHRRIEQLQKQLAQQIAMEQLRTRDALEQQQHEDSGIAADMVKDEAKRWTDEFEVEKEKWNREARVSFEQELRQQLTRQAAAHSDHLQDVLTVQKGELEQIYDRELNTKLIEERQSFQTEMAGWTARLAGIESAVEGRAEAEKVARLAQKMWLACVALNGAITNGNDGESVMEKQLTPLSKQISAILVLSGHHPFVDNIIKTIPADAQQTGVWTEENLKKRFAKVKKVCRHVAMIDQSGGTLFKYFVSYLQSMFLFDSVYLRSETDLVHTRKLDVFGIVTHAEYFLEKGDLEQALRFMNQLSGEPRRVAADWLRETKKKKVPTATLR